MPETPRGRCATSATPRSRARISQASERALARLDGARRRRSRRTGTRSRRRASDSASTRLAAEAWKASIKLIRRSATTARYARPSRRYGRASSRRSRGAPDGAAFTSMDEAGLKAFLKTQSEAAMAAQARAAEAMGPEKDGAPTHRARPEAARRDRTNAARNAAAIRRGRSRILGSGLRDSRDGVRRAGMRCSSSKTVRGSCRPTRKARRLPTRKAGHSASARSPRSGTLKRSPSSARTKQRKTTRNEPERGERRCDREQRTQQRPELPADQQVHSAGDDPEHGDRAPRARRPAWRATSRIPCGWPRARKAREDPGTRTREGADPGRRSPGSAVDRPRVRLYRSPPRAGQATRRGHRLLYSSRPCRTRLPSRPCSGSIARSRAKTPARSCCSAWAISTRCSTTTRRSRARPSISR